MGKCTIRDVAKLAGVGVATVSRVYNDKGNVSEDLKKKVYAAGDALGYSTTAIARTLRSLKTDTIAVVATSITRMTFSTLIKGINDVCQKKGYKVHILETGYSLEKEMELIEYLISQWVDGIILVSSVLDVNEQNKEYVDSLGSLKKKNKQIPVVALYTPFPNSRVDSVINDNREAAYKAVHHLIEIGRKDIAYISIPEHSNICKPRMDGYLEALYASGLENDQLIVYGDFRVIGGYRAMKEIIESGRKFDAVFVGNDEMAIGAMRACKENRIRIPEDAAIISVDDIVMASAVQPSLSTVRLAKYTLGKYASELLIERIEDGWDIHGEPIIQKMKQELIIRESTLKSAKMNLESMLSELEGNK